MGHAPVVTVVCIPAGSGVARRPGRRRALRRRWRSSARGCHRHSRKITVTVPQPAGPGTRVDQEGGTVAYQDRIHGSGPLQKRIGVKMAQSLELPGDCKIEFAKTKGNGAAWQIITAYFDPRHARFEPWLGPLRGYSTSEDAAAVDLLRARRELFSRR